MAAYEDPKPVRKVKPMLRANPHLLSAKEARFMESFEDYMRKLLAPTQLLTDDVLGPNPPTPPFSDPRIKS